MIDCWFWGGLCVVCYQRNKQTKQQHSNNYKSISAVTHWAMFAKQGSKFLSLGNHFATYQHICTSFIVFSMQLEKIYVIFSLIYSVILGIFWVTFFSKHMWGSVQVIWMILACATYRLFIYHPTWASCSEIQYPQTWWDNFFIKYTLLLWQFPDLRGQPGSHCGRPMWHYKRLKIFNKMSVSRKILCWIVVKSQILWNPFFSISHGFKMCFC